MIWKIINECVTSSHFGVCAEPRFVSLSCSHFYFFSVIVGGQTDKVSKVSFHFLSFVVMVHNFSYFIRINPIRFFVL